MPAPRAPPVPRSGSRRWSTTRRRLRRSPYRPVAVRGVEQPDPRHELQEHDDQESGQYGHRRPPGAILSIARGQPAQGRRDEQHPSAPITSAPSRRSCPVSADQRQDERAQQRVRAVEARICWTCVASDPTDPSVPARPPRTAAPPMLRMRPRPRGRSRDSSRNTVYVTSSAGADASVAEMARRVRGPTRPSAPRRPCAGPRDGLAKSMLRLWSASACTGGRSTRGVGQPEPAVCALALPAMLIVSVM